MDYEEFWVIMDKFKEIEKYGYDLSEQLIKDGNKSYDPDYKFYNAERKVNNIISDINTIIERLFTLGDYYDLLYDIETEKDKFLVLKKINNQQDSVSNKLEYALKYIREVNLIDYRVIDFAKDFKKLIESTNAFIQNL
ncbi:MAG: hypothetical protein SOT71_02155 [Romboutsia timonensis]|uniref:hypothetical protein n=1 Tax=Romboutsia timonensis TaxID=1776391 RepID=UPI002A756ED9|nr:hypothetical protein [Romboutsia timonensis]MDY2881439.1 hypothetical protein [Romboutsia timonensis]